MLEWMQRHRKWLVITIWISVIAFVGAGGVGWGTGAFDFNADKAAQVGDVKISLREYKTAYQNVYNERAQSFGGNFDEAQAKAMGLQVQVLRMLIARAQIESFAKDLGVRVSDEEVLNELLQIEAFQVNGAFDKSVYERALANVGMRKGEFEESLRKDLLMRKFYEQLSLGVSKPSVVENLSLSVPFRIQDELEIKVLKPKEVSVSEEEIKTYWEQNQTRWVSKQTYKIMFVWFLADSQNVSEDEVLAQYERTKDLYKDEKGSISELSKVRAQVEFELKKDKALLEAKRNFSAFRDGKIQGEIIEFEEGESVGNLSFSQEELASISTLEVDSILMPIEQQNGYVLIKLIEKIPPKPLEYALAKESAKQALMQQKRAQELDSQSKAQLADFKGVNIGYFAPLTFSPFVDAKASLAQNAGVNPFEVREILTQVSNGDSKNGVVLNDTQAILYKVTNQRLSQNEVDMSKEATELKQGVYMSVLEEYLNAHYKPQIFIKLD